MITKQKLTFIFQKLRHFTETNHTQCHGPQLLVSFKLTWLVRRWFKSRYICVRNNIVICFHVTALHFHQERVVQHLLRGTCRFLQRDIKVSCDLSLSTHPSNKHTTGTAVGLHSAIVSQLCFLLIYWLWTRRGWGHVSAFLCGVVIRNCAAHSSALILLTVTWHPDLP